MPELDGVRHRDVVVRGLRLHVAEAGNGEPVVLQHGWPQHWWQWREVVPALAERYRVLCPDLRGLGWSQEPPDGNYLKEALVDDLIGLLAALELDRVRYVGHDWGGWLGFLLALRRADLIDRMVVLSTAPPWPPRGRFDPRVGWRLWYQLPIAVPAPAAVKLRFFESVLRMGRRQGDWTGEELEAYLRPLREPSGVRASTGMYRTFLRRELKPLLEGRYRDRRLTVPTLFMIGDRDLLYAPQFLETLERHADDVVSEVVPGAGHFLPEECPQLVRDRALDFIG